MLNESRIDINESLLPPPTRHSCCKIAWYLVRLCIWEVLYLGLLSIEVYFILVPFSYLIYYQLVDFDFPSSFRNGSTWMTIFQLHLGIGLWHGVIFSLIARYNHKLSLLNIAKGCIEYYKLLWIIVILYLVIWLASISIIVGIKEFHFIARNFGELLRGVITQPVMFIGAWVIGLLNLGFGWVSSRLLGLTRNWFGYSNKIQLSSRQYKPWSKTFYVFTGQELIQELGYDTPYYQCVYELLPLDQNHQFIVAESPCLRYTLD